MLLCVHVSARVLVPCCFLVLVVLAKLVPWSPILSQVKKKTLKYVISLIFVPPERQMLSALDSPPTASLSHLASEMASITPSSVLAPCFGRDEREVRRCAVPIRACCTLVHASLVLLRLHSYSSCSTFMRRGRTSVRIHRTASYRILECESTDPAARARVCRWMSLAP